MSSINWYGVVVIALLGCSGNGAVSNEVLGGDGSVVICSLDDDRGILDASRRTLLELDINEARACPQGTTAVEGAGSLAEYGPQCISVACIYNCCSDADCLGLQDASVSVEHPCMDGVCQPQTDFVAMRIAPLAVCAP